MTEYLSLIWRLNGTRFSLLRLVSKDSDWHLNKLRKLTISNTRVNNTLFPMVQSLLLLLHHALTLLTLTPWLLLVYLLRTLLPRDWKSSLTLKPPSVLVLELSLSTSKNLVFKNILNNSDSTLLVMDAWSALVTLENLSLKSIKQSVKVILSLLQFSLVTETSKDVSILSPELTTLLPLL